MIDDDGGDVLTAAALVPGEWFVRAGGVGPAFFQCTHGPSGWGNRRFPSSRHTAILANVWGATTDLRVLHTRVLGATPVVRLDAGDVWVRLNDLIGSRQATPFEAVTE